MKLAIDNEIYGNPIQQKQHDEYDGSSLLTFQEKRRKVTASWIDAFKYRKDYPEQEISGLRPPQLGALHSIHAHWTTSNENAIVVMPTGTGKTEVMLSVLVTERCSKLLIIVPTDALRTQVTRKFLQLGILKQIDVLSNFALYPIVGKLLHIPKSPAEAKEIVNNCQIVVSTMKLLSDADDAVKDVFVDHFPFIFVDEAHHIPSPTWSNFIAKFKNKKILQFTATPFRNDGLSIKGKPIYNYPLRKAQEDGYFTHINFDPVMEFDPEKADKVIAEKAVAQLKKDLDAGYDHILMVRVNKIRRAKKVFAIYEKYFEYSPVQIHNEIPPAEQERIREQIINKKTKIIVCVDMLGEGFDLPELKIAAFHDVRNSLPITLQVAGRFTRGRADLGEATFIANGAEKDFAPELKRLYSQDSDWNLLLRQSSHSRIKNEIELWKIVQELGELRPDIPLQNVNIALSTVAYRTTCEDWIPENFRKGLKDYKQLEWIKYDVSSQRNLLVILTAKKTHLPWIKANEFYQMEFGLYVVYWNEEESLLFINSSSNDGYFKKLAHAVTDSNSYLIKGNKVYRTLANINRLQLQKVGLKVETGRQIRYTSKSGSDVEPAIPEAERQRTSRADLYGTGYENGNSTSLGCSAKGRIWSRQRGNISEFIEWCNSIGENLNDESLMPEEIISGAIVPVAISERPVKMPIAIEWPEELQKRTERTIQITIDGDSSYLFLADIELHEPSLNGDIQFSISTPTKSALFALRLINVQQGYDYQIENVDKLNSLIQIGTKHTEDLASYFSREPLNIMFADGSSLMGCRYVEYDPNIPPYSKAKIKSWDWNGINLRHESQLSSQSPTATKRTDSIQYHVIQVLKRDDYDVIIDDDAHGEAADIITFKATADCVYIEFYHCKYSKKDLPGRRLEDLYEVCGQAQRSVRWMLRPVTIIDHILRREPRKYQGKEHSRFEVGDKKTLINLQRMCEQIRPELTVFIVQPGMCSTPSDEQLQLLAVTEDYLMGTYQIKLNVISS